jgi:hypothetical protein
MGAAVVEEVSGGSHSTTIPGIIEDIGVIMEVIQELDITLYFFIVEMETLPLVVIAVKMVR